MWMEANLGVGNHLALELGNDLALELGNHLAPELGNDLALELRNHLTPELGSQLALQSFIVGNIRGPRQRGDRCSLRACWPAPGDL